jgi:hypothetical protein
MSYEDKYLKYKNKYLSFKNQIGGSSSGGGGSSGGGDPFSMGGAVTPSSSGGNPNPQSQIEVDFREFIEANNIEGIKRILAMPGFDVNVLNSDKSITFLAVAVASNIEIFKIILDRSDVNIRFVNNGMSLTILTIILKGFHSLTNPIEKLILLLNKGGLNINEADPIHGFTPIMDLVDTISLIKDTTSNEYNTGIAMLIILLKFHPTINRSMIGVGEIFPIPPEVTRLLQ